MSIKVSVIVPVYNTEQYLRKCLDSLVNQTLHDIEIIIINDGSSDNSEVIIQEYKEKYPDLIQSIIIENGGVSNARNIGIKQARGEYLAFCDSDDYIDLNMLEMMYQKAIIKGSDIVVSGYYSELEDGTYVRKGLGNENEFSMSLKDNPEMIRFTNAFSCSKLFSKKMIDDNELSFKNHKVFEDLLFFYSAMLVANRIEKVDEAFYHYIRRENGSVTGKMNEKFFDLFPVMDELKDFYHSHDQMGLDEYLTYIFLKHAYIRFRMEVSPSTEPLKRKFIKETYACLNHYDSNWKQNKYFENKNLFLQCSVEYWMLLPKVKRMIRLFTKKGGQS